MVHLPTSLLMISSLSAPLLASSGTITLAQVITEIRPLVSELDEALQSAAVGVGESAIKADVNTTVEAIARLGNHPRLVNGRVEREISDQLSQWISLLSGISHDYIAGILSLQDIRARLLRLKRVFDSIGRSIDEELATGQTAVEQTRPSIVIDITESTEGVWASVRAGRRSTSADDAVAANTCILDKTTINLSGLGDTVIVAALVQIIAKEALPDLKPGATIILELNADQQSLEKWLDVLKEQLPRFENPMLGMSLILRNPDTNQGVRIDFASGE